MRDRDKDWVLHSQRPIINEKGKDIVDPNFALNLGKYVQKDSVSKMFWAPEYQTMLRENRLLRQAAVISDTNCIVEIHGVGFNGRMFSEGASSPKFLVIEVYSLWNCQKYELVLTIMQLRLLLAARPDLLKPGKRKELLQSVLHSLYFDYTITIPPKNPKHNVANGHRKKAPAPEHTNLTAAMEELGLTKHQQKIELKQLLQQQIHTTDHALGPVDVEHVAADWAHRSRSRATTPTRQHQLEKERQQEHGHEREVSSAVEDVHILLKSQTEPTTFNTNLQFQTQVAESAIHVAEAVPEQIDSSDTPSIVVSVAASVASEEPANVQTVSHLQEPVMPRGYPCTVEEMIRIPPVPPENSTDPYPLVTQVLRIGPERRFNGITLRKQQAEQRLIAAEKEEQRLRALWLATPKHRRNLVGIRLVRKCNFLVILTSYFDPIRPGTVLVTGSVQNEASRMTMFLGLGRIKDMLDVKSKCQNWSTDELKNYVSKILKRTGIQRSDAGGYAINVMQALGMEVALYKVRTVGQLLLTVAARQKPLRDARMHNTDSLSHHYVPLLEESRSSGGGEWQDNDGDSEGSFHFSALLSHHESSCAGSPSSCSAASHQSDSPTSVQHQADLPVPEPVTSIASLGLRAGWTSLGAHQSSRAVGRILGNVLRPFRELGKPSRLTSRSIKVGPVHCVYALYALTDKMVNYRKPIPTWPTQVAARVDHDVAPVVDDKQNTNMAESDEDEDFLKNGSDSEDVSESEDEIEALGKRKGKVAVNKGRTGSVLSMGTLELGPDDESSLADEKNEAYVALAAGLRLELVVTLPSGGDIQGVPLPATTRLRMVFSIDDLDKFFTWAEKETIARALRAVFWKFYDTATPAEVQQAEQDWDFIGQRLMQRSRWVVRTGLSPEVEAVLAEIAFDNPNIETFQDLLGEEQRREFVETLLQSDAEVLKHSSTSYYSSPSLDALSMTMSMKLPVELRPTSPFTTRSNAGAATTSAPSVPYATLTWSNVVYTKGLKVRSTVPDRGESVRLQVIMFQQAQAQTTGVVCVDRTRHEVYFAQHADAALLLTHIQGFRFITPTERSLQLFLFLGSSLAYAEKVHEVSPCPFF